MKSIRLLLPKIQQYIRDLHLSPINSFSIKDKIDFTQLPQLKESDLEEQFVRGSGPGGQATNKTANAVVLKHLPTGFVVKCHQSRMAMQNRKEARRLMVIKLDNLLNGEMSIQNQEKRLLEKKSVEMNRRQRKLKELKEKWKADNEKSE